LQHKASALDAVLEVVRIADSDQARDLIDYMRNNDSHSDILAFAQSMMRNINKNESTEAQDLEDPEINQGPIDEANEVEGSEGSASSPSTSPASQPTRQVPAIEYIPPPPPSAPYPSLSAPAENAEPVPSRSRSGLSIIALLNED
jgi:hypothetical protein